MTARWGGHDFAMGHPHNIKVRRRHIDSSDNLHLTLEGKILGGQRIPSFYFFTDYCHHRWLRSDCFLLLVFVHARTCSGR